MNHNFRARGVGEHWLLTENILSRVNGGAQMHWAKVRSAGKNDHINISGARHLGRVEPGEATLWRNKNTGTFGALFQLSMRALNSVGKCVGHNPNHNARIRLKGLRRGASSASATSNQRNFDFVTASGLRERVTKHGCRDRSHASHSRRVDELSALQTFFNVRLHALLLGMPHNLLYEIGKCG